jgi:cysteinyl-tRNA synthetase
VGHLTDDADQGEDKIEKAAKKEKLSAWDIARKYEDIFKEYLQMLNIEPFNVMPRATEHIPEQIEMVKKLEEKGYTYRTSDGIYMDTSKVPDYGKLARLDIENLKAGARVDL